MPDRLAVTVRAVALATALLITPFASFAQEPEPSPPPADTPSSAEAEDAKDDDATPAPSYFAETTVTATGTKRDVFEVATPVTVLPQEEIQRKAPDNAADMLREQPGVDISGVGPNQMRPVIRGQRGLRVLFLEDGLRLNNARRQTDFGEITGLIDVDSVETVEVVRGPASVLYGSDAIGGVLNMISHQPAFGADRMSGYFDLRYTQAGDAERGGGGIEGASGPWSYLLGAAYRSADEYKAPAGSFGDIRLDDDTKVVDSGVDDFSLWGALGWQVSDRDVLRLRYNRYDADDAGFGYVPGDQYGVDEEVKIRILYPAQQFERWALSWFGSPVDSALATTTSAQVYYQNNERILVNNIDINIGPIGPGFPNSNVLADTKNFSDLETFGLRAEAVKVVGSDARHVVTYGVEGYRDDSYNTDFSVTTTILRLPRPPFQIVVQESDGKPNAPNATNTSYGVFVQDEMLVLPKLRVTAGLRYHSVETRAEETPEWDITGLDFEDDNVVGSITATYQMTDSLNGLVSYGTAFRAPNIIERLFNGPTPEGAGFQILNPGLESETSENIDIGLKYRRANAFFEAVWFRNDIEDGIIQDFLSPEEVAQLPQDVQDAIDQSGAQFVVQQVNADNLRYEGFEIAIGYHATSGLTLGGNFTHIDSERLGATTILAPDDVYTDKLFAYARYQKPLSRWWMEYNVRHTGDADTNIDPDEPVPPVGTTLPAFTVQNFGAGALLFETAGIRHDVTLWIENLADELYAEFSNASFFRPEPGRVVKISYRLGF